MSDKKLTKVVSPEARLAFPALFVAAANRINPQQEAKFGCTLLFPKATDLSALKALIKAAAVEKFGDKLNDPLFVKKLKLPIQDGDEKPQWTGYPGCVYIRATTKHKPAVIDQACKVIQDLEHRRVYPGCYVRANLHAYGWDNIGGVGISIGFDSIQLVRDGEPFVGGMDEEGAKKVFGVVAGGKDDAKNYAAAPAAAAPITDAFA